MKFFNAAKNKYLTYMIVGSLIFSFTLALSSELYTSNNPCSECHRLWYERCNLLPADPNSYLPTIINKNNENIRLSIEITGSGRNNYYEIDRLSVVLNSVNGILEIDELKQEYNRLYPGDKKILNWDIRAKG